MYVIPPPPRYDHPYHGLLIEQVLPPKQVIALCTTLNGGHYANAWACASMGRFINGPHKGERVCAIVLSNINTSALRRHEIAHCNGWPANHPR